MPDPTGTIMRRRTASVSAALAAGAVLAGIGFWRWETATASAAPPAAAPPAAMAETGVRAREIAFFEARVKEDPFGGSDRARLAWLYLQRARETGEFEDFRRAEAAARASIQARGAHNGGGRLTLASSLLAQHRFAEARAAAEELVAYEPEKPSYRALLAEIQMELGDYAAAAVTFGSLEGESASLAVAPRLARWEEVRGNPDRARSIMIAASDQALARGDLPREQVAWFLLRLADLEMRTGRLRQAEQALRRGLAVEPADRRLFAAFARLEAVRGNWKTALAWGERAGDDADLATMSLMGDAHAALGDRAAAESWWRRLEEAHAESPEPYARQWTQFRLDHGRRLDETRAVLENEVRGRPDALGWDMVAWARLRTGDVQGAREAMRSALRAGTRDPVFLYHAGMIERAAGNHRAARAHLEGALDANPRFHPVFADSARLALRGLPR